MQPIRRQTEAFTYVPKDDRALPPEQQTRFVCNPLTVGERMQVLDEMSVVTFEADGVKVSRGRTFRQAYELLLQKLVAVENFPAGGTAMPYPARGTREQKEVYLAQFPELVLYEVGDEIRDRAELPADAGN